MQINMAEPISFKVGSDDASNTVSYDTSIAPNFHCLLLGNSGTGKTFTLQNLLLQLAANDVTSLVIDTQGDFHPSAFPFNLDEDFISRKFKVHEFNYVDGNCGVNPLQIINTGTSSDFRFGLYNAIYSISLFNRSLGSQQEALLEELIRETYFKAGILEANPETWTNESPSMEDLLDIIADRLRSASSGLPTSIYEAINKERKKYLAQALKCDEVDVTEEQKLKLQQARDNLTTSFDKLLDQRFAAQDIGDHIVSDNVDRLSSIYNTVKQIVDTKLFEHKPFRLKGKAINVLDITKVHPKELPGLVNMLLYKTFQTAMLTGKGNLNPKRPNMVLCFDEGKIFQESKNNPMSPLNRISSEGRKYGLGALFGIQTPQQISQEILNCMGTTFVLPVAEPVVKKTAADYGLRMDDLKMLIPKQQAIFKSGSGKAKVINLFQ